MTHDPDIRPSTHDGSDIWTPVKGRCNQPKTRVPGLCRNPAGKRTDHPGIGACWLHRGNTPNFVKAAEKEALDMRMRDLLAEAGRDPDSIDPAAELLELLADACRIRGVLLHLVGELGPFGTPAYVEYPISDETGEVKVGQPTYRPAEPAGIYGPDHKGDGKPHVLMVMLGEWSDRAARYAKELISAGVEERRVRLAEREAEAIGTVMRGVIAQVIDRIVELYGPDARKVLGDELPGMVRRAIEQSGVIDVEGEAS